MRDEKGETKVCEFLNWSFEATPEGEFKMTHYGLPDLLVKAPGRRIPPLFWFSGVAALGLGAALTLRRFAWPRSALKRA